MIYCKNVFAWSTKYNVRTKYYEHGLGQPGKGICAVANPLARDDKGFLKDNEQKHNLQNYPDYLSKFIEGSKPTIFFMKSLYSKRNHATLCIQWYNEMRIFELEYNQ